MWRKGGLGCRGDRGTLSLFVVLFTPVVVLLAGLLVDGGIAINARERAASGPGRRQRPQRGRSAIGHGRA
jgi:hypothetical protein